MAVAQAIAMILDFVRKPAKIISMPQQNSPR